MSDLRNIWSGASIEEALKIWCENSNTKAIRVLSVIISRGIWKARNYSLFEDKPIPPLQCGTRGFIIQSSLKQQSKDKARRQIVQEQIDKSGAWAYFEGASHGDPRLCGAGGSLHLGDGLFLNFQTGLGPGTNNLAELMALRMILLLAIEKGVNRLQVFGDSLLVMKW